MKNKIIVAILVFVLIAFIFSFGFSRKEEIVEAELVENKSNISIKHDKDDKDYKDANDSGTNYVELIKVDIKGAVKKPGVYEINSDKRVIDIIELAGGLGKNANTNYINLSTKLHDEMVIWIYTNEEISKLELEKNSTEYMVKECNCPIVDNTTCINSKSDNSNNSSDSKNNVSETNVIDLNKATLNDLMKISGIGESKAKQIIEYRNKNGNFKTIEDIKNVSGIGEALFNKIKGYIKV